MFSQDRQTYRASFVAAWAKARSGQALEPLEAQIVEVLRLHPHYRPILEDPEAHLARDWSPEQGEINPFLHLGLHLAVLEQLSLDRPAGIRGLHRDLVEATGDPHAADHRIMTCLAQALWQIQQHAGPFDEQGYLECVRRSRHATRVSA